MGETFDKVMDFQNLHRTHKQAPATAGLLDSGDPPRQAITGVHTQTSGAGQDGPQKLFNMLKAIDLSQKSLELSIEASRLNVDAAKLLMEVYQ